MTFWHDGQVHGLSFDMDTSGKSLVVLALSLYDDEQAPRRNRWKLVCNDVSRFESTLDVKELNDNASAGNIVDGVRHGSTLELELTGGSVKIDAQEFRLDAC